METPRNGLRQTPPGRAPGASAAMPTAVEHCVDSTLGANPDPAQEPAHDSSDQRQAEFEETVSPCSVISWGRAAEPDLKLAVGEEG